jgi:hypothetical protein
MMDVWTIVFRFLLFMVLTPIVIKGLVAIGYLPPQSPNPDETRGLDEQVARTRKMNIRAFD